MRNRGFTLIELLTVISIIGLLASIMLTSLSSVRQKARVSAGQLQDASIYHGIGDQMSGRWQFTDCSGSMLTDNSGAGHSGVIHNGAWIASGGPYGKCYVQFDGTTYIPIGVVTTGSTLTYAIWVKVSAYPSSGAQILWWDDNSLSGGDTYLALRSDGKIRGSWGIVSSSAINLNEWVFIVATGNSAGSKLYIDGASAGQISTPITDRTNLSFVTIGSPCGGNSSVPPTCSPMVPYGTYTAPNLVGSVGGFSVYGSALSQAAVRASYAQESTQYASLLSRR